jgi:prenylated cyclic peptide (anacyclamide/piricyclamide family)
MKTKKLTPRNAAPVQRENTATVSRDGNAISPGAQWDAAKAVYGLPQNPPPFAGDDAE